MQSKSFAIGLKVMYTTTNEIESLVRAFEDHTLPRSQWTHQVHLTVALWYIVHYPQQEAIQRIRKGIQQYNAANEIQTTPTGGYHETITLFWIHMVQQFLAQHCLNTCNPETINTLIHHCGDPALPFRYYSRDRLMSWEARSTWVEPDVQKLP